jgi:hypothetical protein
MPETRPTEAIETLRCNFTNEEKLKLGNDLAEALNDLEALDDEESTIKTAMKSKRSLQEATVGTLARQLSAGFTMRAIKCRLVYDDPNPNEVSTYRLDTEELVKTRPFTVTERQADLPLIEAAPGSEPVVAEVVDGEQSQANIVEFFKVAKEAELKQMAADVVAGSQVDERSDDEPEGEIVDEDPLGIGVDPEKERQDARRSEAAAVRAAKSNLEKI